MSHARGRSVSGAMRRAVSLFVASALGATPLAAAMPQPAFAADQPQRVELPERRTEYATPARPTGDRGTSWVGD